MDKIGEYIQRIEIDSLWSGQKHIVWDLHRKVNILSGVNGVGKSTILNRVVSRLLQVNKDDVPMKNEVKITYYPEDATSIRFDVIRSFDRPLIQSGLLEKLADDRVSTELDWQLYLLQRRFLDYQVNIGNRMIEMLTSGNATTFKMTADGVRSFIHRHKIPAKVEYGSTYYSKQHIEEIKNGYFVGRDRNHSAADL